MFVCYASLSGPQKRSKKGTYLGSILYVLKIRQQLFITISKYSFTLNSSLMLCGVTSYFNGVTIFMILLNCCRVTICY